MAASRSLVFRDKISCLCVRGFPSNEGVKKEYPLKRHYFAVIGSYSVKKTVADRYRHAAHYNKDSVRPFRFMNVDEFERR